MIIGDLINMAAKGQVDFLDFEATHSTLYDRDAKDQDLHAWTIILNDAKQEDHRWAIHKRFLDTKVGQIYRMQAETARSFFEGPDTRFLVANCNQCMIYRQVSSQESNHTFLVKRWDNMADCLVNDQRYAPHKT